MLNKTMRQNIEVAVGAAEILELNPRLSKESEVFSYAYHQVASDIQEEKDLVDWNAVAMIDFKDRKVDMEFSETRAVSVDEVDFKIVCEHFQKQPGVNRVQFAYLTRLVLLYTRKRLRDIKGVTEIEDTRLVEIEHIDGVELMKRINDKAAALIQAGETRKIFDFLEG